MTPLHVAVLLRKVTLVKILLDFGCSTNIKDSSGKTPIDYLLSQGLAAPLSDHAQQILKMLRGWFVCLCL